MTSKSTQAIDKALRAAEIEAEMARMARTDLARFIEFVMKPEAITDPPIRLRSYATGKLLDGYRELIERVEKNKRIVVIAASKLGKSTCLTYGRALFQLGHQHKEYKALIGSEKHQKAAFRVSAIARYIESSERLRLVFPHLRKGPIWRTGEGAISVDREDGNTSTVPSFLAVGDLGDVQGFHFHEHYYDDMVGPVNSLSRDVMEKQAYWINQYEDRLRQVDGKRIVIQNAFTSFDTGHLLVEKYGGWDLFHMPAIDEEGKTLYVHIYTQKAVDEYPPSTKDQHLRAKPRREGDRTFNDTSIDRCRVNGFGLSTNCLIEPKRPDGVFVVHGVDPAGEKKDSSGDEWAMVSALVGPPEYFLKTLRFEHEQARDTMRSLCDHNANQTEPHRLVRVMQILKVQGGHWGIVNGKRIICDTHDQYPGIVVCESNATQEWLAGLLQVERPDIVVYPQHTGSNKNDTDRGISAEENQLAIGSYIIPTRYDQATGKMESDPEVEKLIRGWKDYSPTSHPPDRVAAAWLARCGARLFAPQFHGVGSVDIGSQSGQGRPVQGNPLAGVYDALAERARRAGVPFKPKTGEENDVRERVRRRFF